MVEHTLNLRIYYEDTDAGGVVYHAQYLNFAERGRTEWLRKLGHQNSALAEEFGVLFVVKHVDIEYMKPAVLDDELQLKTRMKTMKNTSFTMQQTLYREKKILSDMHVAIVCVDTKTIKPVRLPGILRSKMEPYLEEEN